MKKLVALPLIAVVLSACSIFTQAGYHDQMREINDFRDLASRVAAENLDASIDRQPMNMKLFTSAVDEIPNSKIPNSLVSRTKSNYLYGTKKGLTAFEFKVSEDRFCVYPVMLPSGMSRERYEVTSGSCNQDSVIRQQKINAINLESFEQQIWFEDLFPVLLDLNEIATNTNVEPASIKISVYQLNLIEITYELDGEIKRSQHRVQIEMTFSHFSFVEPNTFCLVSESNGVEFHSLGVNSNLGRLAPAGSLDPCEGLGV